MSLLETTACLLKCSSWTSLGCVDMEEKRKGFPCALCNKRFSRKDNLSRHYCQVHKIIPDIRRTIYCAEVNCGFNTTYNYKLREHLRDEHELASYESRKIIFESLEKFWEWKHQVEKASCSKFFQTSKKKLGSGYSKYYFSCNRTGIYKPKGNNKRALKFQGSCKINGHCTAFIICIEEEEKCIVEYCLQHYAHNIEVGNLSLDEDENQATTRDSNKPNKQKKHKRPTIYCPK
ncbi:uncharacterized protein LOC111638717 [Centruroides sculpturatus]|uniref:uncharacterized protein LOC111638717 n=1 Tax=Centruroides sculpturatus TaxID=218467 RepID=UPI000C6DB868|nr:uncharacterized protein LOC111638717 [Centruroides sculpturatus]